MAIVSFLVSAGCCVWILLPRFNGWQFSINANALMPFFLNDAAPEEPDALYQYLAAEIQEDFEENGLLMENLYKLFVVACLALGLEVGFWLFALGV